MENKIQEKIKLSRKRLQKATGLINKFAAMSTVGKCSQQQWEEALEEWIESLEEAFETLIDTKEIILK